MDKKTENKIYKISRKRFCLELKGTMYLGRAMKLNWQAYVDGLMGPMEYLQTRENYLNEFKSLLDQEMPVK